MNKNQKGVTHVLLIPAQVVVHTKVDEALKNNGAGTVGRALAQLVLLGLGAAVHSAVENS
jgi:hypothetical protein